MIRLQSGPIRLDELLAATRADTDGAVALFVGTVRGRNAGRRVLRLEYHAWPEMASAELARIADETRARHEVSALALVHRTGVLAVGETSVAVVVAAPHRGPALAACRFAIEALKRRVPIWKREIYEDGAAWIAGA